MKYKILTLFPEMFNSFKSESIIKRAIADGKIGIETINIRDYANNKHNNVDDIPYGGGAGMVMQPGPIVDAIKAHKGNAKVYYMSPQGKTLTQAKAYEMSKEKDIIILCGHYEGIDERVMDYIDEELSIGDYVLTGGEVAAMVCIDATARLVEGVIKEESHMNDSHSNGMLDHPHYTRPVEFEGKKVPEVLMSGHHKNIKEWRDAKALENTKRKRPDLLKK